MPWKPHYTREQAQEAITDADSWAEVLEALGYGYYGKNINTVRKWAARWEISVAHLPSNGRLRYTEQEARDAIAASMSWAEALRRLGYCHSGGNAAPLKRRAEEWGIPTDHFDPYARFGGPRRKPTPLSEVLVRGSTYSRSSLKRRLYEAGIKERRCELCGQDELWQGKKIGLILDHVNGIRDDNRLENLRIVCPNCAASLDTHCGRKNRVSIIPRECPHCGSTFLPKLRGQRYCSSYCGSRWDRSGGQGQSATRGVPKPNYRKVERPPYEQLMREIEASSYLAVGRRYGVSDNAVRKWVRFYEGKRAQPEHERRRQRSRQLRLLDPIDVDTEGESGSEAA